MQRAAFLEAERIEISQDARVRAKLIKEPMPSQVALRDDFAGIVRMIDAIMSDEVLFTRLGERLKAVPPGIRPRSASVDAGGDVAIDAATEVA